MKFQDMSEEDLEAVVSYIRSLAPARHAVRVRELNVLGRVVKAFLMKPIGPSGNVPAKVTPGPTPEYGRYLANSVAACVGCHTRRDLKTGAATGPLFAGGLELREEAGTFVTPNLTPDPATGRITTWSEETFVERFHMGPKLPGTPMPWHAFRNMTDDDLRAIYRFLRSLPPSPSPTSSS